VPVWLPSGSGRDRWRGQAIPRRLWRDSRGLGRSSLRSADREFHPMSRLPRADQSVGIPRIRIRRGSGPTAGTERVDAAQAPGNGLRTQRARAVTTRTRPLTRRWKPATTTQTGHRACNLPCRERVSASHAVTGGSRSTDQRPIALVPAKGCPSAPGVVQSGGGARAELRHELWRIPRRPRGRT